MGLSKTAAAASGFAVTTILTEREPAAGGSAYDVLRDRRLLHRVEIQGGVLAPDALALRILGQARCR